MDTSRCVSWFCSYFCKQKHYFCCYIETVLNLRMSFVNTSLTQSFNTVGDDNVTGWSSWSNVSCPTTCGRDTKGSMTRTRECLEPSNGTRCSAPLEDIRRHEDCGFAECPGNNLSLLFQSCLTCSRLTPFLLKIVSLTRSGSGFTKILRWLYSVFIFHVKIHVKIHLIAVGTFSQLYFERVIVHDHVFSFIACG